MANTDALMDLEMKTFLDTVDAAVAKVLKRHSELAMEDLIIEEFQPDDFDDRDENDWDTALVVGANTTTATSWQARCEDGKLAMIIGGFYMGNQASENIDYMTVKVEDNEARRWGGQQIDTDFRWVTLAPLVVMEGKRMKILPNMRVANPISTMFPFGMVVRER